MIAISPLPKNFLYRTIGWNHLVTQGQAKRSHSDEEFQTHVRDSFICFFQGKLRVKWMAVESLETYTFMMESDV